jgi:hypothetical protein
MRLPRVRLNDKRALTGYPVFPAGGWVAVIVTLG